MGTAPEPQGSWCSDKRVQLAGRLPRDGNPPSFPFSGQLLSLPCALAALGATLLAGALHSSLLQGLS